MKKNTSNTIQYNTWLV